MFCSNFFFLLLCIFFAAFVVIQYKYPCLLVYLYYKKHALCTTWFLNSSLTAVNQAQSTDQKLFDPGSLGHCAEEKKGTLIGLKYKFQLVIGKLIMYFKKKKKICFHIINNWLLYCFISHVHKKLIKLDRWQLKLKF